MSINNGVWCSIYRGFIASLLLMVALYAYAQNDEGNSGLTIAVSDVRVRNAPDEKGLYIYIKKKAGIYSVLLTESSERFDNAIATYTFRTYDYNQENGDELRRLNGVFIKPKTGDGYFIIDSTSSPDELFGEAFVLFVPYRMQFGYPDTRNGAVDLTAGGSYVSLRTFEKPYADYTGAYQDNSFFIKRQTIPNKDVEGDQVRVPRADIMSQVSREINPRPSFIPPANMLLQREILRDLSVPATHPHLDLYSSQTEQAFSDIARKSGTSPIFITPGNSIVRSMRDMLMRIPPNQSVDMVVAIDTTRSMHDDIEMLRSSILSMLNECQKRQSQPMRLGIVAYKDVNEEYVTKKFGFTDNLISFGEQFDGLRIGGGGDWAEEVYTALNTAIVEFSWRADNRLVFLIGDAPPHDPPKTRVYIPDIFKHARQLGVRVYPFIIPKP